MPAGLPALAGGLFGIFNRGVFPDFCYWPKSAEVLIMTILGGIHNFWGPAVGAAIIILLNQYIVSYTEYWPFVLGLILLVLLFAFPGGVVGAVHALARRVKSQRRRPVTMLECRKLRKTFSGFVATDDVSLTVETGSIAAIIGPNGAGKSTLFNVITGHLEPDSGEVLLEGRNITGIPPHKICGMGIARSFQRTNIFSKLTVYENIQAAFIAHGGKGLDMWSVSERQFRDETGQMIEQLSLQDIAYTLAGEVSHGAQKQVELGIALAGEPRMLLLDEPTAGMSAQETHESIALLARIAKERALTLLFTEHDMEVVFSIADKIAVLHQGRIIATGLPDEVRQNEEVRRVYLGGGKH